MLRQPGLHPDYAEAGMVVRSAPTLQQRRETRKKPIKRFGGDRW